jgi:hypothetical protein
LLCAGRLVFAIASAGGRRLLAEQGGRREGCGISSAPTTRTAGKRPQLGLIDGRFVAKSLKIARVFETAAGGVVIHI